MKRVPVMCLVGLFFLYTANISCTFSGGDIILPDISNLSIKSVSTFVPGDSVTVTLYSSSLLAGSYIVYYSLSGANVIAKDTAIFNLNDSIATFTTPALTNPGNTTLFISEITSSSGGNATVMKNNTITFSDSIGLMTAKINDTGSYRVTHVTATLAGTLLTIKGINWNSMATITLNVENYTGSTGTINFNAGNTTSDNGNALYSTKTKTDSSQHGIIIITNTAPLITGTFSYTNKDSSTISSGTFSCPAP